MKNEQRGFTLVEAMVAIMILTMSLFAVYGWANVSIQMLVRSDEVLTQELMLKELSEQLSIINLKAQPSGEIALHDLQANWIATPVESASGRNNIGTIGYYDHTLYQIDIEVMHGRQIVATYVTRKVESIRTRDPVIEG